MKKKTILVLILIALIIFLIYVKTKDTSVYYVNIIDENSEYNGVKYSSMLLENFKNREKLEEFIEFEYEDYRITDLTKAIQNNEYIYINDKKHTLQNALIKADLLTVNIGKNDIDYGLLKKEKEEIYNYLDTLLMDLDILLSEIRKYTKEQVMLIGYKKIDDCNKEFIEYFNLKAEKICNKMNVEYISVNEDNDILNSILSKFTFK